MQARTYYQIVLLNSQTDDIVQIWQSERIAYRAQGCTTIEFEDSKCDLLRGIAGPS